jgi:hypothetical protein
MAENRYKGSMTSNSIRRDATLTALISELQTGMGVSVSETLSMSVVVAAAE